jgi:signal transduction histidine kinase
LTLMLGPLEDALADSEQPLPRGQQSRMRLAHDNALRLLKLVTALLDFSRLEAGRMSASYAPLEIAQFTAELAGMFQSAVDKGGLKLVVDCPRLSEPVWVDRDMWEKIVSNLVTNAFKFTLAGEIAVRIREEGSRVVLEVSDTGVGIPEAELPRIFERFHRVAGTVGRTHEGTGIGLSLVHELVQLHAGTVSVQSAVGRGTTFRVEIPKGQAHLPADAVLNPKDPRGSRNAEAYAAEAARWAGGERTAVSTPTPPEAKAAARPRALVVDDNADLREYISGLLTPIYEVTTAPDGLAALEAIRSTAPDVVVSDVMMPRLDGFGLVRALREDPSTASIPVILLSARAGEEESIEGLDSGADDYLVKPFSARELLARVRTHLELQRARRAWISQLSIANRELEAFSYSVSHDLRAPLRTIEGFSRALVDDCAAQLGEIGQAHIERILRGVERMGTLIDALLELARVTRAEINRGQVDLSKLAAEIVAELRRAHPEREVQVQIEDGLLVDGDSSLLGVVLTNLLGNAWKFTARNETALITFGRHDAHEPAFFVRDNGAGFDPNYASRLFTPFQRLHTTSEFEGTGVGLATVQRVIHRHGGRIWAEGAAGKGATFYFSIPKPVR